MIFNKNDSTGFISIVKVLNQHFAHFIRIYR